MSSYQSLNKRRRTRYAAHGGGVYTYPRLEQLEDRMTPSGALSLTVFPSAIVWGQSVTLSGSQNIPDVANAGDTIQFLNHGTPLAQTATLDSLGSNYSLTTSTIPPGNYSLIAHDSTNSNVLDGITAQSLTVSAVTTTFQVIAGDPSTGMPLTTVASGQQVFFEAIVQNTNSTGATPTGTIQFNVDGVDLGSPVPLFLPQGGDSNFAFALSNVTTFTAAGGSPSISTHYVNSDGEFTPPASDAGSQLTVDKASTTTSNVTSSRNPTIIGQAVTLTATVGVVSPGGGTPTGTVSFIQGATTMGTGTLNASGTATFSTSSLAGGNHTITASYGGDINFTASDDKSSTTPLVQVVNKLASAVLLASAPNPSVFGQAAVFIAFVVSTGNAGGTPTGAVTLTEGSTTLAANVSLSNGHAAFSTTSLAVGSHTISAVYAGDGNFKASSSSTTQMVNRDATLIALSASANPSAFGQVVTFTATVGAGTPGSGVPTGTVDFKEGTSDLTPSGVSLSGGRATFTASSLSVGQHTLSASYNGDARFLSSRGDDSAAPEVVNKGSTRTVLTAFPDPAVFGQTVSFTANVSVLTPGKGTPTGSMTFTDGTTTLGNVSLNASGRAVFTTTSLSRGSHAITATYTGDSNFLGSAYANFGVVVQADATTTTVTVSVNPAIVNSAITFTAAVQANAPGGGTPTGTITFKDITTAVGTATLNGSGQATFSTPQLALGTHAITATYGGNTNFTSSVSAIIAETVKSSARVISQPSAFDSSTTGQSAAAEPRLPTIADTMSGTPLTNGSTEPGGISSMRLLSATPSPTVEASALDEYFAAASTRSPSRELAAVAIHRHANQCAPRTAELISSDDDTD
jgi:hypothetical protein